MDRAILRTCEPPHRDPRGRFVTGNSGRPRGPNRVHRTLREAIVLAAAEHGFDGRGSGDLPGFLRMVCARSEDLLRPAGALHPARRGHSQGRGASAPSRSVEEVEAELAARGIDHDYLALMAESMAKRAPRRTAGGTSN